MAEPPTNGALSGSQLSQTNRSSGVGLPGGDGLGAQSGFAAAKVGGATEQASAFRAALAEGASSPNGLQAAVRTDLQIRNDATSKSGNAARSNTTLTSGAATVSGRNGETLDVAKIDLPILKLGSTDHAVGLLQRALAVLGSQTLRADNMFGAQTDQSVRSFQEGSGLAKDGVVGNRQTWPAINQALVKRHEGVARIADAMGATRAVAEPKAAEMRQLSAVLAEFAARAAPPATAKVVTQAAERQESGEVAYTVRGGETLSDVARMFSLPVSALIAANPEVAKPYLILQGQLLTIPNPVKDRTYRRPPRQLRPADPEGYLASANMNPDFVTLVNGMIAQLRAEGYDVRVIAGFRSFTEQQERFEQGRRSPGAILTDAEGGHSWHNYGLAVDIVLNDDDGSPAWPQDCAMFWQRLGDVALAHGGVWGGLFGYPAHVDYPPCFERDQAGSLIEEFEIHGLDAIWERIALHLAPDV